MREHIAKRAEEIRKAEVYRDAFLLALGERKRNMQE